MSSNGDDNHSLREESSPFRPAASFSTGRFHESLSGFVEAWDEAEAAIKEAELFRGEVVFASIKELRYAGRRFNDALKTLLVSEAGDSKQSDDIEHLLREASENCIRARNDAVDALIAYLHRYFSRVRRDYGTVLMNAYFPQFTELFVQLNAVARVVPESRSTERQRRNEIYDRIVQNDMPALRQLYEQIETSKDLIDEEAQRESHTQRKRERFNRSIGVIGAVLSAIGVALALITL